MQANQNSLLCMDLFPLFPYNFFNHSPQIKIAALGGESLRGQLIFHEQQTNTMLLLNPDKNQCQQIVLNTDSFTKKISQQFSLTKTKTKYNLNTERAFENLLVVFPDGGKELEVLNFDSSCVHTISLPFIVDQVHLMSDRLWMLTEKDTNARYFLSSSSQDAAVPNYLTPIASEAGEQLVLKKISTSGMPQNILEHHHEMFDESFSTEVLKTTRLVAGHDLASLAVSHPEKVRAQCPVSLYSYPRNLNDSKGLYRGYFKERVLNIFSFVTKEQWVIWVFHISVYLLHFFHNFYLLMAFMFGGYN